MYVHLIKIYVHLNDMYVHFIRMYVHFFHLPSGQMKRMTENMPVFADFIKCR
jgi:hypothetical protein